MDVFARTLFILLSDPSKVTFDREKVVEPKELKYFQGIHDF